MYTRDEAIQYARECWDDLEEWANRHPDQPHKDLMKYVADPNVLMAAFVCVRRAHGAETPGIDRERASDWEVDVEERIKQIANELQDGTYRPSVVKRVQIPKGNGKTRAIGILTIRDRVVQTSTSKVVERLFDGSFCQISHGFRPGLGVRSAVERLLGAFNTKEGQYVLEGDITRCFDSFDHNTMMDAVAARVGDERVNRLIEQFLTTDILEEGRRHKNTGGVIQGGALSPVLANVYLHAFDLLLERMDRGPGRACVRYADDFVILVDDRDTADRLKTLITEFMKEKLGLELSSDKTKITHVNEGFDFLGWTFIREKDHTGEWVIKVRMPKKKVARRERELKDMIGQGIVRSRDEAMAQIGYWTRPYGLGEMDNPVRRLVETANRMFNDRARTIRAIRRSNRV